MANITVQLNGISKIYGNRHAVKDVSFTVAEGEFVTLLGPSGCGKTTTLNMIAGFTIPDLGEITLKGRDVTEIPPFGRDLGLVFQDYALFPHMTVAENIAFGLQMRKVAKSDIPARVNEALDMVRLGGYGDRKISALSGGQRQRVALARALVIRPAVLLLDEPTSNLDQKLREDMRLEISALQRRMGIATILVTHDQEEALSISDKMIVMNNGCVEQIGTPTEIYDRPSSRFVADFIGNMSFLPAQAVQAARKGSACVVELSGHRFEVLAQRDVAQGEKVVVGLRPERCALTPASATPPAQPIATGVIKQRIFTGSSLHTHVDCAGTTVIVYTYNAGSAAYGLSVGETVSITANMTQACVY